MRKIRAYGSTRTVVSGILGVLSYLILMALLFMPLVAGF